LVRQGGHSLRLYFNEAPPDGQFPKSAERVVLTFPRLWTHLRLARELHNRPPDLFFTPAHVIPFSYRGPSVATVHDLGFRYFPQAHTRRQVAYLRWSTGHNARRSRRVVVDSRATRDDLVRFYDTDPNKIDVIYPGIDPELAPERDPQKLADTQHRLGIHPPYILYIGTLQPRKNLTRLIDAFAASQLPHQLVIAGKAGWLARSILDTAFNYQSLATNNILLPGFVADDDKAALISGAEALLYPSLHEGFGFPVLEGQVCGTPVMCADTSSLPEIAGDGALLVDPLDTDGMTAAIRRIVGDQALRQRLRQAGLDNVKRFTWEQTAARVMQALEAAAA
jgi:glycosyltransferase involved in cell wall biosynthesis